MKIIEVEQGSPEWLAIRCGKFTASEIFKICAPKGFGETGKSYIFGVIAEHLTSQYNQIESKAMQWGKDYEPYARELFERLSGEKIEQTGFIESDFSDKVGFSPDGLGKNFGIEIKCPYESENHLKHLLLKNQQDLKELKPQYYWQCMFALMVTDFDYWEFISFDPRFTNNLQMFVMQIKPVESEILFLKGRLTEALEMYNDIIKRV